MRKHEVKIKDEEDFIKDLDNNAILNTNIKGLNLYKMRKRTWQESIETINTLKERISQLEQIIEKLVKDK